MHVYVLWEEEEGQRKDEGNVIGWETFSHGFRTPLDANTYLTNLMGSTKLNQLGEQNLAIQQPSHTGKRAFA